MSYPARRVRRAPRVVVASRCSGINSGWMIASDGLGALVNDKDITRYIKISSM